MGNGAIVLSLNSNSAEECELFSDISICRATVTELRTALLDVLNDCHQYDFIKDNALNFVSSMSWDSIADKHKQIYELVADQSC